VLGNRLDLNGLLDRLMAPAPLAVALA
jgi:hypothetical protein